MSEIHDILAQVVDARAAVTSDLVLNLRTGAYFSAEIEANPDIAVDAELGKDLREQVVLHVRDVAADIQAQDQVRFTLFGQQVTMRIVERSSNPGNPFVEYRASKIVDDIDT